jgi:hypothetical protein
MDTLKQLIGDDVLFDQLFDLSKDSLWGSVAHRPPLQVSRDHPSVVTQRIVDRQIPSGRRSRYDFRIKWREILYEMIWFGPSLVIISAGFDAHDDDPLADLELTEKDYAWATEACLLACRSISRIKAQAVGVAGPEEVKCVSILEGGYHLEAISKSSIAHVKALFETSADRPDCDKETNPDTKVGSENISDEEIPQTETGAEAVAEEGIEEAGERLGKVSIEDLLLGLDQSIGSLLMEALMSLPDTAEGDESDEAVDAEDEVGDETES